MNFEGAKPIPIPRYGSSCSYDDEVNLPLGLAKVATNQRYTANSTATRFGHSTRIQVSDGNSLTGGGLLRYLAAQPGTLNLQAAETILIFTYGTITGDIWSVPPFLQADLVKLTNAAFFSNSGYLNFPGMNPVMSQGFNNLFITLGDLLLPSSQSPLVYNSSDSTLYPASDIPFGAAWNPNTRYRVGQVVSPSTFQTFGQTDGQGAWIPLQTGYLYQCTQAGLSSNVQPDWPQVFGATIVDNSTAWEECTPVFISGLPDGSVPFNPLTAVDSASPIIDGATVYICCTLLNPQGEGTNQLTNAQGVLDPNKVLVWTNTTGGPVDLTVSMGPISSVLLPDGPLGDYGATGMNVYVFIDPDSSADASQIIDPTYYAKANIVPLEPTQQITISGFPGGAQLPQTSTAATTAEIGNVDTGIRYMTVFFQMETGYQTGFTDSATFPVNVTQSGWPIQCIRLPIGPYNCQARICPATVSGASAAGPYTWISQSDIASPGFNQPNVAITATIVEDNTSTTATFNFTDTYLPGATDVTNYLDIIQIPPSVDVYFAKTLQRMVYTGAVGFQSGHLFSDIQKPEMVRIPGSNFQVSENDGDRTVCYREIRGIGYSFKENSGYAVENSGGDPSTWTPRKVWGGNGPVGALAIDIAGQDDSEFAMWVHRSGVYMFTGQAPTLVSREKEVEWETINWDYGHLIKLRIDQKRRLVHILAPTGDSTVCNTRFVINYYFGTGDPVVFVPRRGELVPNVEGRKWSQDDLDYYDALYIPQKSRNAVQTPGVSVKTEMVFFSADGSIKTMTDNQYWDEDYKKNQVGYFSNWIGVLGSSPSTVYAKLAGARMWGTGNGLWNITAYDDNNVPYVLTGPLNPLLLTPGVRTRADLPMGVAGIYSMRWSIGMDNGGVPGQWWEVFKSDLMIFPMWPGAPTPNGGV